MSHTTTQKAVCNNEIVLRSTCQRVDAEYIGEQVHSLFQSKHRGHGVKLKGWRYPIIFTDQEIYFDDYNGKWGNPADLNKFLQLYPIEATKLAYAGRGTIVEQQLDNGDIRCVVTIGGGTQLTGNGPSTVGPGGIALA